MSAPRMSNQDSSVTGTSAIDNTPTHPQANGTGQITVATIWLDGCSGCHMSFLDLDERLVELAGQIDVVYSPLVDSKELPEQVDVGIIEGAISSAHDLEMAHAFRQHCKLLISLGDCAVNGNVPSLRNHFKLDEVFARAYTENISAGDGLVPSQGVPALLTPVRPVHGEVDVDLFVPGCPPQADAIWFVLSELLAGRTPDPNTVTRFGA